MVTKFRDGSKVITKLATNLFSYPGFARASGTYFWLHGWSWVKGSGANQSFPNPSPVVSGTTTTKGTMGENVLLFYPLPIVPHAHLSPFKVERQLRTSETDSLRNYRVTVHIFGFHRV